MPASIEILNKQPLQQQQARFASEVKKGLCAKPKFLPSQYFYDKKGSQLFQSIMDMPEYYLTRCELEILQNYKEHIADILSKQKFRLIELGSGDGRKTQVLLDHFHKRRLDFEYIPIDISSFAVQELIRKIKGDFPEIQTRGVVGEYTEGLDYLSKSQIRNCVLFLGSSLGNFHLDDAKRFCRQLNDNLQDGDLLLLGMDMVKDPQVLLQAYQDEQGITKHFNLNLLERINVELGGAFDTKLFEHHVMYDPVHQTMKSYLLSQVQQNVYIRDIDKEVAFSAWEPIHTEYSWKYSKADVSRLAKESNFSVVRSFSDKKEYFLNSLWEAQKNTQL